MSSYSITDNWFDFQYGSEEWNEASKKAKKAIYSSEFLVLKKLANKVPDLDLLYNLHYISEYNIYKKRYDDAIKFTKNEKEVASLKKRLEEYELICFEVETEISSYIVDSILSEKNPAPAVNNAYAHIKAGTLDNKCSLGFFEIATKFQSEPSYFTQIIEGMRSLAQATYKPHIPENWLLSYKELEKWLMMFKKQNAEIANDSAKQADTRNEYRQAVRSMGLKDVFPDY